MKTSVCHSSKSRTILLNSKNQCLAETEKELHVSTQLLQLDNSFDPYSAVSTPLYQTATFKQVTRTPIAIYPIAAFKKALSIAMESTYLCPLHVVLVYGITIWLHHKWVFLHWVWQPSATDCGPYDYTRSGNPTRDVLERYGKPNLLSFRKLEVTAHFIVDTFSILYPAWRLCLYPSVCRSSDSALTM